MPEEPKKDICYNYFYVSNVLTGKWVYVGPTDNVTPEQHRKAVEEVCKD